MIRVKICGLSREEDIRAVNQARPDFIGFVFAPSRRQVSFIEAALLKKELDCSIAVVGVFQNEDPLRIQQAICLGLIDLVQLHGNEDEAYVQWIRRKTGVPVIKALSVREVTDITRWQNSAADFLLLDHGAGGSGSSFDWRLARLCKKPFFLAGGLSPSNVCQAIRETAPYAVDVSSGVETKAQKDENKILSFIQAVRNYETENEV